MIPGAILVPGVTILTPLLAGGRFMAGALSRPRADDYSGGAALIESTSVAAGEFTDANIVHWPALSRSEIVDFSPSGAVGFVAVSTAAGERDFTLLRGTIANNVLHPYTGASSPINVRGGELLSNFRYKGQAMKPGYGPAAVDGWCESPT